MIPEGYVYLTGETAKSEHLKIHLDREDGKYFHEDDKEVAGHYIDGDKIIAFFINEEQFAENEYDLDEEHEAIDWLNVTA